MFPLADSHMILGVYSDEVHLLPFRTEKLSPSAQMVLGNRESMSTPLLTKSPAILWGFFCLWVLGLRDLRPGDLGLE